MENYTSNSTEYKNLTFGQSKHLIKDKLTLIERDAFELFEEMKKTVECCPLCKSEASLRLVTTPDNKYYSEIKCNNSDCQIAMKSKNCNDKLYAMLDAHKIVIRWNELRNK